MRDSSLDIPGAEDVTLYDDLAALSAAAAARIAVLAQQAIAQHGTFSIALAGGGTPRRCYEYLCQLPLAWAQVQVYFGDERCLPRGDAQRNDSMAAAALLDHVAIPPGNVHAIPAELGAREAAAAYANNLPQQFDLVLLGMGEDGHTASLFPGNPALLDPAPVVAVYDAPKPPPERVSLGLDVLNAARAKLFLVAGGGKHEALTHIVNGAALPAARIDGAEWFVDRMAWPQQTDQQGA